MKRTDVIEYFGSQTAVARALGITTPSVAEWGDFVPPLRQIQIERLTKGKLKAQSNVFDVKRKPDQAVA